MRAEALAAHGHDRHRAHRLLAQAEGDLDTPTRCPRRLDRELPARVLRAPGRPDPRAARRLKAAGEHYALSVAARRPAERRTRALIGAELARIQVIQRQPDQAAQTLLGLRDDITAVSSRRLARALAQVRTAWRPYPARPRHR